MTNSGYILQTKSLISNVGKLTIPESFLLYLKIK